jgi:hypothetical protein
MSRAPVRVEQAALAAKLRRSTTPLRGALPGWRPVMPIRRMLEGGAFEPKAAALLIEAFDAVVAELDLRSNADREKAAKIVVRLALGQRSLEAAKIRDQAIIEVRKETGTRHRRPF